jgi:hypothetical protein
VVQFKPTIPLWSTENPAGRDFMVPDSDWPSIESEYGRSISPIARQSIVDAMRSFLLHVEAEQAAASIADAKEYIERIKTACVAAQCAIGNRPDPDVGSYAHHLINRQHHLLVTGVTLPASDSSSAEIPEAIPDALQAFSADAGTLERAAEIIVKACDRSLESLGGSIPDRGRRKGETWDNWVFSVGQICEQYCLPTKVRKDQSTSRADNTRSGIDSPFVRLIRKLERQFSPGTLSINLDRSLEALSAAVSRALRA